MTFILLFLGGYWYSRRWNTRAKLALMDKDELREDIRRLDAAGVRVSRRARRAAE